MTESLLQPVESENSMCCVYIPILCGGKATSEKWSEKPLAFIRPRICTFSAVPNAHALHIHVNNQLGTDNLKTSNLQLLSVSTGQRTATPTQMEANRSSCGGPRLAEPQVSYAPTEPAKWNEIDRCIFSLQPEIVLHTCVGLVRALMV